MKKLIILFSLLLTLLSSTAYAENDLAHLVLFHEVLGDTVQEDITHGTMVAYGKAADIRSEDLQTFLNKYWNFTYYERVVSPRGLSSDAEKAYIKIWNTDKTKSYIIYADGGILLGKLGDAKEFRNETRQNYVWYMPSICNGRTSLYNAFETLKHTYFDKNYEGYFEAQRDITDEDTPEAPTANLLRLDGASEWSKPEIEKSAAYNLLVYQLTDKYSDNITRKDFCDLAYKAIITYYYPDVDSRLEEWGSANIILSEKGLLDAYNAVNYTDYTDDKNKFLSAIGVMNGMGDGIFAPDELLTREQAATILHRMALFLDSSIEFTSHENSYSHDGHLISDWAKDSVNAMHELGIMNGISENEFAPQGTYTVEQAIATTLRLYEYLPLTE